MSTASLLLLVITLAWGDDTDPPEPAQAPLPAAELGPTARAELVRLRERIDKLVARGAWAGVERVYGEMRAITPEVGPEVDWLGAEAARMEGDTWTAYQRLTVLLRDHPDHAEASARLRELREGYGRLTVRRVEATPIALTADVAPFAADQRASLDRAAKTLQETGGFDGMIPVGGYQLGGQPVTIAPGLQPVVVQRRIGE